MSATVPRYLPQNDLGTGLAKAGIVSAAMRAAAPTALRRVRRCFTPPAMAMARSNMSVAHLSAGLRAYLPWLTDGARRTLQGARRSVRKLVDGLKRRRRGRDDLNRRERRWPHGNRRYDGVRDTHLGGGLRPEGQQGDKKRNACNPHGWAPLYRSICQLFELPHPNISLTQIRLCQVSEQCCD